jgi:hypothetical protein
VGETRRDNALTKETRLASRIPFLLPALLILAAAISTSHAETYTTIDFPGAVQTSAVATNDAGTTIGTYILKEKSVLHIYGFVRDTAGHFSTIHVPNAVVVQPMAINSSGVVTGWYQTNDSNVGGFAYSAEGQLTYLGDPGSFPAFVAYGINAAGAIVGDASAFGVSIGFEQSPADGFHLLEAGPATGINSLGTIVGSHLSLSTYYLSGYILAHDGALTEFSFGSGTNTYPVAINDSGYIVGYAYSAYSELVSFLRDPSGNITAITIPTKKPHNTRAVSINSQATVAGNLFYGRGRITWGFVRFPDGTSHFLVPPNSRGSGVGNINDSGVVTGWYGDLKGIHGFVWTP